MPNDIPDTYKIRELQERIAHLERSYVTSRDMYQAHQQEWRDALLGLHETIAMLRKEKQVVERLCKDAAALLQEVPDLDSERMDRQAWIDQRNALLKQIEQEVT